MSLDIAITTSLLAFARLLPVTLLVPYLGGRLVPGPAKVGLALILALVLAPDLTPGGTLGDMGAGALVLLGIKEALVGLTIGFVGALVFYGIQMAGSLIDTARGQSLATALVPGLSGRESPMTALMFPLAIVVYLALNGHHLLLRALAESFETIPVTGWPSLGGSLTGAVWQLVDLTGSLFVVALAIGLPVLVTVLIVDLALGVLSRAVPQLHSFFLGLPLKSMLGIFVVLVGLVVIAETLTAEVDQSLGWVRWFVDALAN